MAGAVDRQPFETRLEHLLDNRISNALAAIRQGHEIFGALDLLPIDPRVAAEHPHALLARQRQIYLTHGAQELLVDRALPDFGTARISPDRRKLGPRQRNAFENEAIQQVLMNRISGLDDNHADRARKLGMSD